MLIYKTNVIQYNLTHEFDACASINFRIFTYTDAWIHAFVPLKIWNIVSHKSFVGQKIHEHNKTHEYNKIHEHNHIVNVLSLDYNN